MSEIPRIASTSPPTGTQESVSAGEQSASAPQRPEREKESPSSFARFKKTCTPFGNKLRWLTGKKNNGSGTDVPSARHPPVDDGRSPHFRGVVPLHGPNASNDVPFSNDPGAVRTSAAQDGYTRGATQKSVSPVPMETVTIKTDITHASDQVKRQELRPPYPDLVVLRGDLLNILNLLDDETYEPPRFADPTMIANAAPTSAEVDRGDSDSLKTHTGAGSDNEVDQSAQPNHEPRPIAELTTVSRNAERHGPRPMPPTWATTTDLKPNDTSKRPPGASGQRASTLRKLSTFVQNPFDAISLAKRRRQAVPTIVIPPHSNIPTSDTDGLRSAMKSTTPKERQTVSFAPSEHSTSDSDEEK